MRCQCKSGTKKKHVHLNNFLRLLPCSFATLLKIGGLGEERQEKERRSKGLTEME